MVSWKPEEEELQVIPGRIRQGNKAKKPGVMPRPSL